MGSSAQNSSGVHWCRRRVRFNEIPAKVPRLWCRARSGSTVFWRRFRRRSEPCQEVPEKVPGSLGAKAKSGSTGSVEGSGQGLGGFGAEKVPEKAWEALEHAEVFPALCLAACLRNSGKNKTLRLLGIPPKLIFICCCCVVSFFKAPHVLVFHPATARIPPKPGWVAMLWNPPPWSCCHGYKSFATNIDRFDLSWSWWSFMTCGRYI